MNLSIHNHILSNTNYALIKKITFKEKILSQNAFTAEPEIVERIKTLPQNVFMDSVTFLKFCKSVDITPKISRAIKNRLAEVWQTNASSKSFIG